MLTTDGMKLCIKLQTQIKWHFQMYFFILFKMNIIHQRYWEFISREALINTIKTLINENFTHQTNKQSSQIKSAANSRPSNSITLKDLVVFQFERSRRVINFLYILSKKPTNYRDSSKRREQEIATGKSGFRGILQAYFI